MIKVSFYILWLGLGSALVAVGWHAIGNVHSADIQRALRALLVASVFAFAFVGSDSSAILIPAWALFADLASWPAAIVVLAVFWAMVYGVLLVVSRINLILGKGGRK